MDKLNQDQKIQRVPTGCRGLDEMLSGGFLPGSATLLEGSPGTGKTTLGLQFILNGVEKGEHGLVITFEEFPEQFYDCAGELGWDLRGLQKEGKVDVIFTTPDEFLEEFEQLDSKLAGMIEEKQTKRILVDSITHFEKMANDIGRLRSIESDLINSLKREEITSLLLKENPHVLGGWSVSNNKIPFIVDTYLLLRYLEVDSEIKRGLMILKMRGSDHDKEIRQFRIDKGGLQVGGKFEGISGIFLGTGVHRPEKV